MRLARLCSRVEGEWAGQETGLLDQLASLLGEEGRALRLDMRTLEARPVELRLDGHVLATLDSGASRSLAASGYNERREECRGGSHCPAPRRVNRRARFSVGTDGPEHRRGGSDRR